MRYSILGLVTLAIFAASTPAAAATYVVTDLGTLGGSFSVGQGINDAGQVVGQGITSDYFGVGQAFLSSNGVITGIFGESATGINNAGQITVNYRGRAFVSSNGINTDLGTLGGSYSNGFGINNAGQVTGSSHIAGDEAYHAFISSNGVMTDLGTLDPTSYALSVGFGINSAGVVAGASNVDSGSGSTYHAFISTNGIMTDLGTLGGDSGFLSVATGINDAGQVAGYGNSAEGDHRIHAFLYSNGVMTDLGTLGVLGGFSQGNGINNAGQVVGISRISDFGPYHAFISSNGIMTDLNNLIDPSSGWVLNSARAINNSGQITGYGDHLGASHAFLLSVVSGGVPEPSTWMMMLAGFGLVGGAMRRRSVAVRYA